jgi:hypothetical protein
MAARLGGPVFVVTIAACAIGLPACDDGPTGPSPSNPGLTETTNSIHYVVHSAPGDTVDTAWQDGYYEWLVGALQLQSSGRLDYHKYRDRAHMRALTGRDTNGYAEPGTTRFHTIWPTDNHEGVHAMVILQIGHPPALFNEGVAVAHQTNPARAILTPQWNGTDLHVLARQYQAAGRIPALSSLLRSRDFFDFDANVMYPCSGSFVRYLIDTHGLARLKQYFGAATFDDEPSVTESRFFAAYGRSVSTVWNEWLTSIRSAS